MVDRTHECSASLGTSTVRSHSPYCEATGPIVDEGFVAARIHELQKAYHQAWTPTQSHSPMSPCPIYPKLQRYEHFSRTEPYEPPTGSSASQGLEQIGGGTPRSLRHNHVSARYLSNSDGFGAWNRSADDLKPTRFLLPKYRTLIRKSYSASSDNLNDSLEEQAQKQITSPAAILSSTSLTAEDRMEHVLQTKRRLLLKSDQGSNEPRIEKPKSGFSGKSTDTTRSAEEKRNGLKEGSGIRYHVPAYISQLLEQKRVSDTPQDQLTDVTPSQATNFPSSSPAGETVVQIQNRADDGSSPVSVYHQPKENQTRPKIKPPRLLNPPAASLVNQDMDLHVISSSPQKSEQSGGQSRASLSKGGYGGLSKAHAQLIDATRLGSDADGHRHAEASTGSSSDLSDLLNRARRDNVRRQSLPARLNGSNRHPSSASAKTPSIVSSTRSSSLWKKWRSWKLVLVDKNPSPQDLSNRLTDSSRSSVNEIMNQPREVKQANLDPKSSPPSLQPTQNTRPTDYSPEIHRAGGVDKNEARFSIELVPKTQLHQSPKNEEAPKTGTSRGDMPANISVKVPAATSARAQPSQWVATFPLNETLQESDATSLCKDGGDEFGESTNSTGAGRGQRMKKIQVVISFDEVADLVIEAHLKGKQTP